jgi:hypothetical protein
VVDYTELETINLRVYGGRVALSALCERHIETTTRQNIFGYLVVSRAHPARTGDTPCKIMLGYSTTEISYGKTTSSFMP